MKQIPDLVLVGDGRLARHLTRYFTQLGLSHAVWSRHMHADGHCPELRALIHAATHALLAISDDAIESFIDAHPELQDIVCVHFSGRLVCARAIGAHPLFSFADTLYERALYERIPFILDEGSPSLSTLIPGLPNQGLFIDARRRERYHALCVLAGNFTTLLWRKFFFELDREFAITREHALPYLESVTRALAGDGVPLSGPLSRGDRATIAHNLEALTGDAFEEVYRAFIVAYERQGREWLAP